MPTAARMAAAVLFGALTWYVSQLIEPLFPEGSDLGWYAEINAVIGFILGWVVAGSRAGGSWSAAVSYGMTTMVAIVFWGLLLHSGGEMVRKSLRKMYDGPSEAVVDVFGLMWEYANLMATQPVLLTLLIGGIAAGLITEVFGRNFR
jgi:hypothetical protein